MAEERHVLTVEEGVTERLDRFVSERLELSRTRVQKLLSDGCITVDGAPGKKSLPVESGMAIEVVVPAAESVEMIAEDLPLDIVHEDDEILVVNKASGMVVHPAPGHRSGTLVNADGRVPESSTDSIGVPRDSSSSPRRTSRTESCPTRSGIGA